MRRLNAFAGRARVVELRHTGWIAARKPDRFGDLALGIGTAEQEPARSCRGAEHVAGAGALEAAPEMARLHRQPDADDGLVASDDGGQHLGSGRADVLGGRERRRPGRDARMQHCAHVGVIGVVARAEADIEKRRVLRVERVGREQDMRNAGASHGRDIVASPATPWQARAERCHAHKVEQQEAELAAHVLGQRLGIECCGEFCQRSGRPMFFLHLSGYSRETLSSSCPALCRASTYSLHEARRGWPGRARP
jgi:hypothetical protein